MQTTTKTTCPYCGVGCGVIVEQDAAGAFKVRPDKEHPANLGRLCSKGTALAETLTHPQRLLTPRNQRAARVVERGNLHHRQPFPANHRGTRRGCGGVLRLRATADRRLLRCQ